jgi:hypothetical protein
MRDNVRRCSRGLLIDSFPHLVERFTSVWTSRPTTVNDRHVNFGFVFREVNVPVAALKFGDSILLLDPSTISINRPIPRCSAASMRLIAGSRAAAFFEMTGGHIDLHGRPCFRVKRQTGQRAGLFQAIRFRCRLAKPPDTSEAVPGPMPGGYCSGIHGVRGIFRCARLTAMRSPRSHGIKEFRLLWRDIPAGAPGRATGRSHVEQVLARPHKPLYSIPVIVLHRKLYFSCPFPRLMMPG